MQGLRQNIKSFQKSYSDRLKLNCSPFPWKSCSNEFFWEVAKIICLATTIINKKVILPWLAGRNSKLFFFFITLIQEVYVEILNGFRLTFWQLSLKMLLGFMITGKLFGDGKSWWEYWQYLKLQGNALVMGGSCNSCGRSVFALWLADWISQELWMLSRSLSDCKSLLLNVMIQSKSLSL